MLRVTTSCLRASLKSLYTKLLRGCKVCFLCCKDTALDKYLPGKELHIADVLCQAFLKEQKEDLLENVLQMNMITPQRPISEEKLHEFRKATAEDLEMQLLKDITQRGWPNEKRAVPKELQKNQKKKI